MSIKPPISLQASYGSVSANSTVSGSPVWNGFPNAWEVELTITTQLHGYYVSGFNGFYDGTHVQAGDWLGIDSGDSVQITQIVSATGSTVRARVRDVDEYNIHKSFSGQGMPAIGSGFIFRQDDEGYPVIDPGVTSNLAPQQYLDIISRFQYTTSAAAANNWLYANNGFDFDTAPTAVSGNAIALGNAAEATEADSIAIGSSARVSGQNSFVIGNDIQLNQDNSFALGNDGVVKLFADASGNIGIGTTDPKAELDIFNPSATSSEIQLTTTLTGTSADSGTVLGVPDGSIDFRIANQENAKIRLETGGFERFQIDTNGFVTFMHGDFATSGDAGYKFAVLKGTTTGSGAQTWLTFPDSTELDMPDETAWTFEIDLLGKKQAGTTAAAYRFKGVLIKATGDGTVQFVESPMEELMGESVSAFGWEGGVSADPSTGALRVFGKVSGTAAAGPVNWLAMVKITQISL